MYLEVPTLKSVRQPDPKYVALNIPETWCAVRVTMNMKKKKIMTVKIFYANNMMSYRLKKTKKKKLNYDIILI